MFGYEVSYNSNEKVQHYVQFFFRSLPCQDICSPETSTARPKSANFTTAFLLLLDNRRFSGCQNEKDMNVNTRCKPYELTNLAVEFYLAFNPPKKWIKKTILHWLFKATMVLPNSKCSERKLKFALFKLNQQMSVFFKSCSRDQPKHWLHSKIVIDLIRWNCGYKVDKWNNGIIVKKLLKYSLFYGSINVSQWYSLDWLNEQTTC